VSRAKGTCMDPRIKSLPPGKISPKQPRRPFHKQGPSGKGAAPRAKKANSWSGGEKKRLLSCGEKKGLQRATRRWGKNDRGRTR